MAPIGALIAHLPNLYHAARSRVHKRRHSIKRSLSRKFSRNRPVSPVYLHRNGNLYRISSSQLALLRRLPSPPAPLPPLPEPEPPLRPTISHPLDPVHVAHAEFDETDGQATPLVRLVSTRQTVSLPLDFVYDAGEWPLSNSDPELFARGPGECRTETETRRYWRYRGPVSHVGPDGSRVFRVQEPGELNGEEIASARQTAPENEAIDNPEEETAEEPKVEDVARVVNRTPTPDSTGEELPSELPTHETSPKLSPPLPAPNPSTRPPIPKIIVSHATDDLLARRRTQRFMANAKAALKASAPEASSLGPPAQPIPSSPPPSAPPASSPPETPLSPAPDTPFSPPRTPRMISRRCTCPPSPSMALPGPHCENDFGWDEVVLPATADVYVELAGPVETFGGARVGGAATVVSELSGASRDVYATLSSAPRWMPHPGLPMSELEWQGPVIRGRSICGDEDSSSSDGEEGSERNWSSGSLSSGSSSGSSSSSSSTPPTARILRYYLDTVPEIVVTSPSTDESTSSSERSASPDDYPSSDFDTDIDIPARPDNPLGHARQLDDTAADFIREQYLEEVPIVDLVEMLSEMGYECTEAEVMEVIWQDGIEAWWTKESLGEVWRLGRWDEEGDWWSVPEGKI